MVRTGIFLDHLAADGAGLAGSQVAVVAVLQVNANFLCCLHQKEALFFPQQYFYPGLQKKHMFVFGKERKKWKKQDGQQIIFQNLFTKAQKML